MLVTCPACSAETRLPWLRKHSGLELDEMGPKCDQSVLRAIEGMVQAPHGLVTFWGDFGSGKTMALQILVNELRELRQVEGYYATFATVLSHLRNLWSNGQDSSAFWERLLNIPVLALDEVTRFDNSKLWAQERLFDLIDTRYRKKATHLTAFATNEDPTVNLTVDDPVGYLFSRMREGAMYLLEGDLRQAMSKKER